MENQHTSPAVPQPLPWYDDRVEAVRKDAAPVAEAESGMELLFDFDDRQHLTNVRFKTERVSSVSQALGLMKICSPVITFRDNIDCLAYEYVTPEEFQRMLGTVKLLDSMWHYPDGTEGPPPRFEMNVLMLLANAIEQLQDRSGEA